ncbi:MAG: ABC transporter permease [Coriobacteriia bacterium]
MSEAFGIRRHWKAVVVLTAALAWMLLDTAGLARALGALFPSESVILYERQTLLQMFVDHMTVTAIASSIALVAGGFLGLLVLTPAGRRFKDVVVNVANFGQTFPSVAVIALVVPAIGYGWEPVVLALVIYSVLPVMLNIVVGISSVPPDVVDAARGMGLSRRQRFLQVELPLAMPVIAGGIKNMLIINVSAATLGAIVGAGGLGVPILAGIGTFNNALVLEGALPTALVALIIDRVL